MPDKYSGRQITIAGNDLRNLDELSKNKTRFDEVMSILTYWRICHELPLNTAFKKLQLVVNRHDEDAIFAKRLKRYISIYSKLRRFKHMTLRNMQDIGGCRAIIRSEKRLRRSIRELKSFPEFKTPSGKIRSKDYIKSPKEDGYRGYHLIGRFESADGDFRNIEIQLRTKIQHSWATALEIVDLFTGQALKSNQGKPAWSEFFREVSKQFAIMDQIRAFDKLSFEQRLRSYTTRIKSDRTLVESCSKVQARCKSLKIVKKFGAFAGSIDVVDKKKISPDAEYVLLQIDTSKMRVKSKTFTSGETEIAAARYSRAEKKAAQVEDLVVALVSTAAVGSLKEAYPNFFADSSRFIEYLNVITSVVIIED